MLINDIVWLTFLLLSIGLLLIIGVVRWSVSLHYREKRNERMILKFADYTAVLSFFMEKAYDIIHKDKILIYSLEATKLSDKDFGVYSKEFIRLTMKLMGPTLTSEMLKLHGDLDTFTFYLVEFFNSKYEDDEIRRASVENLMQSDIEVPEALKHESTLSKIPGQP